MLVSFVVFFLERLACIIVTLKFEKNKAYVCMYIWLKHMVKHKARVSEMASQLAPNCKQKKENKQKNKRKQKSQKHVIFAFFCLISAQFVMIMSVFFTTEAFLFQVVTICIQWRPASSRPLKKVRRFFACTVQA